jgi:FkbM family methyltransferase
MDIFAEFKKIVENRDAVVVECGCHDGYHTGLMCNLGAQRARSYRHIAVEADARIFWQAVRNVGERVVVIQAAVSDQVGKAPFWLSSGTKRTDRYAGSSSLNRPTGVTAAFNGLHFDSTVEVETVTLDSIFRDEKLDHVDFIWADVQGSEKRMIRGGLKECLPRTRYLYTEYGPGGWYEDDATLADIVGLLPGWKVVNDFGSDVLLMNEKAV